MIKYIKDISKETALKHLQAYGSHRFFVNPQLLPRQWKALQTLSIQGPSISSGPQAHLHLQGVCSSAISFHSCLPLPPGTIQPSGKTVLDHASVSGAEPLLTSCACSPLDPPNIVIIRLTQRAARCSSPPTPHPPSPFLIYPLPQAPSSVDKRIKPLKVASSSSQPGEEVPPSRSSQPEPARQARPPPPFPAPHTLMLTHVAGIPDIGTCQNALRIAASTVIII